MSGDRAPDIVFRDRREPNRHKLQPGDEKPVAKAGAVQQGKRAPARLQPSGYRKM
jgi:hypothetical protein